MMNKQEEIDAAMITDEDIVKTLQDAADAEEVFSATREWSLDKMRQAIYSRGDYFDRKGALVFELDGKDVLRVCMCSLPVTIGSGERADCRLEYEGISRVHCRLEAVGNLVRLSDSDSKNGTRLNGKVIDSEDLCDGDIIQIGTVLFRVKRT
jgi:pSer/pThr/pTyr-binding forkhead associated (FHA) protein